MQFYFYGHGDFSEKKRKVDFDYLSTPFLGNASLFTKLLFTFLCPFPPPPNQQNDGFPLEFLLKGPQTELRTLSKFCEQTLEELRTNRIMNKRAFLSFGLFGHRGRETAGNSFSDSLFCEFGPEGPK